MFKNLVGVVRLDYKVLDIRKSVGDKSAVGGEEYCATFRVVYEIAKGRHIVLHSERAHTERAEMISLSIFKYSSKMFGHLLGRKNILVCGDWESVCGVFF